MSVQRLILFELKCFDRKLYFFTRIRTWTQTVYCLRIMHNSSIYKRFRNVNWAKLLGLQRFHIAHPRLRMCKHKKQTAIATVLCNLYQSNTLHQLFQRKSTRNTVRKYFLNTVLMTIILGQQVNLCNADIFFWFDPPPVYATDTNKNDYK